MNSVTFSQKQLEIQVCLGNCCFLKGTNDIIHELKRIIRDNDLSDRLSITPKTCLDQCENAPVIVINDELITNVRVKDLNRIVKKYLCDSD